MTQFFQTFHMYFVIFFGSLLLSYIMPRFCFRIARGKGVLSDDDKSLLKFLSITFFILFLVSFSLLHYAMNSSEKQILACKKANGVYVYQKHSDNQCIEKTAYDEYQQTVEKAKEKYLQAIIPLK